MCDVISKVESFLDIDRGEYAVLMFVKSNSVPDKSQLPEPMYSSGS